MAYGRRSVILIGELWAYSLSRFYPLKVHVHYGRCWMETYFSWGLDYFYTIWLWYKFFSMPLGCVVLCLLRRNSWWELIISEIHKKMVFIYWVILQSQTILQHFYKMLMWSTSYWFSSKPIINFIFSFTNNHSLHQQFVKNFLK